MKKEKSFFNILIFVGIIFLIGIFPFFIWDRSSSLSFTQLPLIFGFTIFEICCIILALFITFIIAFDSPYKIIVNDQGLYLNYIFTKNRKISWQEINRIKFETQLMNTIGSLIILKGFTYKKLGVYRIIIYTELAKHYNEKDIRVKEMEPRDTTFDL